jgi:hypothetical protein
MIGPLAVLVTDSETSSFWAGIRAASSLSLRIWPEHVHACVVFGVNTTDTTKQRKEMDSVLVRITSPYRTSKGQQVPD